MASLSYFYLMSLLDLGYLKGGSKQLLIYLSPILSLAKINDKPLNLEVDSNSTKLSAEDWTLSIQVRVLDFSECLLPARTSFPIGSGWCIAQGKLSLSLVICNHSLPTALMLPAWTCIICPSLDTLRKFSECHSDRQQPWQVLKTANGVWLHLQFLWEAGHILKGGHLALAMLTSSWCLTLRLLICLELFMEMGVSEETPLIQMTSSNPGIIPGWATRPWK